MIAGAQNGGLNMQPAYCSSTGSASVDGGGTGTLYCKLWRYLEELHHLKFVLFFVLGGLATIIDDLDDAMSSGAANAFGDAATREEYNRDQDADASVVDEVARYISRTFALCCASHSGN